MREDDDRCARRQPADVLFHPFELVVAELGETGGFETGREVEDVDQCDEMHASVIEAIPASAFCALAVAVQIRLAVVGVGDIMLARYYKDLLLQRLHRLIGIVEFLVLRQMSDVTGMNDEGGPRRHGVDLGNCLLKGAERIGIRRFVKADMAVANLQEGKAVPLRLGGPSVVDQPKRARYAAAQTP